MHPSTVQRRLTTALTRAATFGLLALAAVFYSAHDARAQWATNGTNINNTNPGGVGIGTAAPQSQLDVAGTDTVVRSTFGGTTGSNGKFQIFSRDITNNPFGEMQMVAPGGAGTEYLRFNIRNSSGAVFPDVLTISRTANVGIGTITPSVKLSVGGAGANVYATDAWVENNAHVQGNETLIQGGRGRMRVGTAWSYMGLYAESSSTGASNDLVFGSSSGMVRVGPGVGIGGPQNLIVPNGYFGVGTAAPSVKLSIGGPGANVYATDAWVENNAHVQGNESLAQGGRGRMRVGTAWGYMGLYAESSSTGASNDLIFGSSSGTVRIGPGGGIPQSLIVANGKVGIGTTTPTAALDVAGNINVSGNINAKYQDVAEWVPSKQKLNAGTVVILDTANRNHVTASATAYDTRVAGVVSAQPGIALGEAGEGKALVATTGRVKVRVDATKAPIGVGDLLVTGDAPGVAMKSQPVELGGVSIHRPGTIIGKALEPLEKGTGEILVLLSLQ